MIAALALVLSSYLSPTPATAQTCPTLQGKYQCGPRGGAKSFGLDLATQGNHYRFASGPEQPFEVIADNTDRATTFGSASKYAEYRANCAGGKLNIALRMRDRGVKLSALDSYYNENKGVVRVRILQPDSEVQGPPSVVSCQPVIPSRHQPTPAVTPTR